MCDGHHDCTSRSVSCPCYLSLHMCTEACGCRGLCINTLARAAEREEAVVEEARYFRFMPMTWAAPVSCTCKVTFCDDGYCMCRRMGEKCSPLCGCTNCINRPEGEPVVVDEEHVEKIKERRKRRKHNGDMRTHIGGCACRKSACASGHCACRAAGRACTDKCICTRHCDCKNRASSCARAHVDEVGALGHTAPLA